MKRILLIFALLSLVVVLPACGSETADQGDITPLAVVTGDSEVSYTVQQLQALPEQPGRLNVHMLVRLEAVQ